MQMKKIAKTFSLNSNRLIKAIYMYRFFNFNKNGTIFK